MLRLISLLLLLPALVFGQVVTDQTKTGVIPSSGATLTNPVLTTPRLATSTFAAVAAGNAGAIRIASDLGTNGSVVMDNGTRWRPWNGFTVLSSIGPTTTTIGNTETFVCQTLLPTNSWQNNDIIRIWSTMTKSGGTDTGLITVRIGTAGTVADQVMTGLNAFAQMAASGVAGGGIYDIKLISATSAQKVGSNGVQNGSYTLVSSSTTAAVATTITSAAANPLYVSVGIKSSGASNTVGADVCRIELHTP